MMLYLCFQQVLKQIEDFKYVLDYFDLTERGVVFIFSREPAEIDRFRRELGAKSILMRRPIIESEKQSNSAELYFNPIFDDDLTISEESQNSKLVPQQINPNSINNSSAISSGY